MLHIASMLALTFGLTAPNSPSMQIPVAADSSMSIVMTAPRTSNRPRMPVPSAENEPRRVDVTPWPRYLTVAQEEDAWHAQLEATFHIDHSG